MISNRAVNMSVWKCCSSVCRLHQTAPWLTISRRGAFFSRGKKSTEEEEDKTRSITVDDGHLTRERLNQLATKSRSLTTRKPYTPPDNVEERVKAIVRQVAGPQVAEDWQDTSISNPRLKYKILTHLITEFDHQISGAALTSMRTVQDAVEYFRRAVRETSVLEDMVANASKLPPNLHVRTEYHRFDPETDTMFGGRTAFPGRDTHVTSIKYRRKYQSVKTTIPKSGFENHYYGY